MSEAHGYQRFFAELKRRRVFRVMAVYGVVGFVLLQVVDLAVPALLLPDWTYRLVALILLIGFPVAVILAWAFDATPEGVKKTEAAEPGEIERIVRAPRRARWPAGVAALVGAAALLWGAWYVGRRSGEAEGAGAGRTPATASQPGGGDAPGAARPATGEERRTLAVLPFDNISGDPATEPFTEGVHDDLLTQLSKIRALRVTSRTSVKEYRDTDKPISEIARDLGVGTILEGGVQRSGSQVRINVQLIDASTDEHLWAETYDAELTAENVFQIQSRIARSVAGALEAELSPAEQATLAEIGTRDLEALAAYHAGREAWYTRATERRDSASLASFERAVELDPGFADAWAGKAKILSWIANARSGVDPALAREAVERADSLAPGSAETALARGYYDYYVERDFDAALAQFRVADRLRPSDAGVAQAIAFILRRQGDWGGAVRQLGRAVELDPRNGSVYVGLGETLTWMRRYRMVDAVADRGLVVDPGDPALVTMKLDNLVNLERGTAGARRYADGVPPEVREQEIVARALARLAAREGNLDESIRLTRSVTPPGPDGRMLQAYLIGAAEKARGNADASRRAGEEVERIAEGSMSERGGIRAALRSLGLALQADTTGTVAAAREAADRAAALQDALLAPNVRYFASQGLAMVGAFDRMAEELTDLASAPAPGPSAANLLLDLIYADFREAPQFPAVLAAIEAAEAEAARLDAHEGY
jgi:TolB-like protein